MNSEHFTLHEVVGGVWAAEGDLTGASIGNAAIIDAGGKTVIVDTFMTSAAADELRAAAERLTGNQVYLAVNSHWHGDHTGGNQVFADVPIVSTRETLDTVAETAPDDLAAWQAEIDASISSLEEQVEAGDESAVRRLRQQKHFRSYAESFSLTLPNLIIDGRLVVEGERRIEIETRGKGHTVSDTFVWLPDDRVLVTGDLCWNGIHPRLNDGFPAEWGRYAQGLVDMGPAHVIPGHGLPGGPEALEGLPEYFRAIDTMVDTVRAGTNPNDLSPPGESSEWAGRERMYAGIEVLAAR